MKVNHILCPLDFSQQSRLLNSEIEWLASRFSAVVTLLHVIEIPNGWYGGSEALATLEWFSEFAAMQKQRLEEYKIGVPEHRVRRVIVNGGPAWHIAEFAKENDADLIVMGTHGFGALRRMLLGSVAMKVLHDVDCPVWMHSANAGTPSHERRGVSSIICSLDLSEETVPLLRSVNDLAHQFNAKVELIHTCSEVGGRPANYFDSSLHRALKDWAIHDIAKRQMEAGTNFPLTITESHIGGCVTELASRRNADLIVIGRGRMQGKLGAWRTHAYEIIRRAPCPVLSFCGKAHLQALPEFAEQFLTEQAIA